MTAMLFLLGSVCAAGEALTNLGEFPVSVKGPWTVQVGPGSLAFGDKIFALKEAVSLEVPSPQKEDVKDEKHEALPLFDERAGGWRRGNRLKALITQECSATGLLLPGSVRVKCSPGKGESLEEGRDYALDGFWATLGRLKIGEIEEGQTVFVDYQLRKSCLHAVVMDKEEVPRIRMGEPDLALVQPACLQEGDIAIAYVWVPGDAEALDEESLFPLGKALPRAPMPSSRKAQSLCPQTWTKLTKGEAVRIVAWGDSVTNGGGVSQASDRWQNQFAERLRKRFPKAEIEMITAAWGGANSKQYMDAPAGGEHDFARDVLEPRPDLVVIEFVNDAYLNEEGTQKHYQIILDHLRGIEAEVILMTPHLVRPDWMGVNTLQFDEDPRPYVKGLKRFAGENKVPLADASSLWCGLWRQGIPYVTLLGNSINHPDARGHALFADALMELF